jgi:hypothetical protein
MVDKKISRRDIRSVEKRMKDTLHGLGMHLLLTDHPEVWPGAAVLNRRISHVYPNMRLKTASPTSLLPGATL